MALVVADEASTAPSTRPRGRRPSVALGIGFASIVFLVGVIGAALIWQLLLRR